MATLVLSAAGAALGGSIGGTVLGLSTAVLGKAIGASLGSAIDQKLLGSGSQAVETGRIDRFRIQGSAEGASVPRLFGQMRLAGQVIWASKFLERSTTRKTGRKGSTTKVTSYSYSVSLALALCEGEVTKLGRVWADGNEISLSGVTWRLHKGSENQAPDPLIEAVEGAGTVPAFRGTAYIVFENLELGQFGNRIPQFNFEVTRRVRDLGSAPELDPFEQIKGVALVPGTGEYALAKSPVRYPLGKGNSRSANQNNVLGATDLVASVDQLKEDMPQVNKASLVVSWFGDDLNCNACTLRPKVEQRSLDGDTMPWVVSGQGRSNASLVSLTNGRPTYGGTPADASVVEAISHLRTEGIDVMFYPFILMDVVPGNSQIDPWTGQVGQPVFPWRGRITLNLAPGTPGSVDKTATARQQVMQFFGAVEPSDFAISGGAVSYSGPQEWSYRRFILHYAHLCAAAGGVDTFIIGSEMRGMTRIRDQAEAFPVVAELVRLAADVRSILGAGAKISYAADWSEYFGYHPQDGSNDVFFNLDPLWASANVDFVGIDNYMPLSDWRDTLTHADASFGSIYDQGYLEGNVAGGEGFDWYYGSDLDRDAQTRTSIIDTAHGEDWVFRYKDLTSWWSNSHYDRPSGVKASGSTPWVPQSKPIVFTELGCPAVNKGTNQPNVFLDAKSSEGQTPYYSNASRDDFIQYRYFQAHLTHWGKPQNNPVSVSYGQPMVDLDSTYIWAWDTRPWPDFPNRAATWSDGENYGRGHWISGRVGATTLASVVKEISARSNLSDVDVADLHGSVRGYMVRGNESARQSLQPLMLSHSFESAEISGNLVFANRGALSAEPLDEETLAVRGDAPAIDYTRGAGAEIASTFNVSYYQAESAFQIGASSAALQSDAEATIADLELPVSLNASEGANLAAKFLSEAHIAADQISFSLPLSQLTISPGDVVHLDDGATSAIFRIDQIEEGSSRLCRGSRVEHGVYQAGGYQSSLPIVPVLAPPPAAAYIEFLDLPLLTGAELPHAPYIAASQTPWTGALAAYSSSSDFAYALDGEITRPSTMGNTLNDLDTADPWIWAKGSALLVAVSSEDLQSQTEQTVLNGANLMAIRSQGQSNWEILQFQAAELVGQNQYRLTNFLRGQLGTESYIPPVHPAGADVVFLTEALTQPTFPIGARGLERHYRIGPTSRSYDDPSFQHLQVASPGTGLRPYAPVHLRAARLASGDVDIRWVRQTRLGGDSWEGLDVPLSEELESYAIRLENGGSLLRETTVQSPSLIYFAADQTLDGAGATFDVSVAQLSQQYGHGPFERITFNG